jgi:hypothetical protein
MPATTWCNGMGVGGWLVVIVLWMGFLALTVWAITRLFPLSPGPGDTVDTAPRAPAPRVPRTEPASPAPDLDAASAGTSHLPASDG